MTVIPLFCSRFLKAVHARATAEHGGARESILGRPFQRAGSTASSTACSISMSAGCARALKRPGSDAGSACWASFVASLGIYPFLGLRLLPADRRRPVHDQRQGAHRNAHRSHQRIRGEDRRSDPPRSSHPKDLKMIALEHRRGERFLVALHHQRRHVHRHHSGGAERRPQGQQL